VTGRATISSAIIDQFLHRYKQPQATLHTAQDEFSRATLKLMSYYAIANCKPRWLCNLAFPRHMHVLGTYLCMGV